MAFQYIPFSLFSLPAMMMAGALSPFLSARPEISVMAQVLVGKMKSAADDATSQSV